MSLVFIIEILLELFFGYKVYTEKDKNSIFLWYFSAMVLLYPGLTISPANIPPVATTFAIIATCRLLKDNLFRVNWQKFPFKFILILIFVFNVFQAFTINWQPLVRSVKMEIFYFLSTYYLLFIGFCFAPSYEGLLHRKKWLMCISIILFFVAVFSALSVDNFIGSGFSSEFIWSTDRAGTERGFRVTGTQASPSIFGMINVLLILLINHFHDKSKQKIVILIILVCNVFLCATRTPILELVTVMALYYAFQGVGRTMKAVLALIPLLIIGLSVASSIPMVNNLLSGVTDLITTGGENTGGSSAELREAQLGMAAMYMMQSPWFGNGLGYTNNLISEDGLFHDFYDYMLAGAEGYIYFLFIDFGIIYMILFVCLFLSIFSFFWVQRKYSPNVASIGVCTFVLLSMHLAFTRPDHSWEMLFPVVGVFLRNLVDKVGNRQLLSR